MKNDFSQTHSRLALRVSASLLLVGLLFIQFSVAFAADTPVKRTSSTGTYTWGLGAKPASTKPSVPVAPKIFQERLTAAVGISSTLPTKVDYTALVPPVGTQGMQGSCVGWAVGYYYKTIQEYRERGWSLTDPTHQFSPSFIYNQINNGYDNGAWPDDAFALLKTVGDVSIVDFPYNQSDYRTQPSVALKNSAAPYKAKSALYLFYNSSSWPSYTPNPAGTVDLLRQYLASGDIFTLTFPIYDTWDYVGNTPTSVATKPKNLNSFRGYHEVAVIGYDDTISSSDGVGAFRVVNQWGTSWGDNGFTWLSYAFLTQYGADASAMTDLIDPVSLPYSVAKASSNGNASSSPNWSLTGSHWYPLPDSTSLSGVVSYNATSGETLDFPFRGTSITWIGPLNQQAGVADIYIDGIFQQRVDQWREGNHKPRSVVYHRADLPLGNHTFRLVVQGPIVEHCPNNWSCTPFPVQGGIMVDALLVNASVLDDTDTKLVYSPSWNWWGRNDDASYNTTETRAYVPASSFTYSFVGTTVTWAGATGPYYGRADIFLDDKVVASVELYSPTIQRNQVLFSQGGLTPANHTLKIVVRPDRNSLSTNTYVGIDYVMASNL